MLKELDFVIVINAFFSSECSLADVVLPACTSIEQQDIAFYPSCLAYSPQAIQPLFESRPESDIVCCVATALGVDDRALSSGTDGILDLVWKQTGGVPGTRNKVASHLQFVCAPQYRLAPTSAGLLNTASGKAELAPFLPVNVLNDVKPLGMPPQEAFDQELQVSEKYPLALIIERLVPQFMRSGCLTAPLSADCEPCEDVLFVCRAEAAKSGLLRGELVKVVTHVGSVTATLELSEIVPPGVVLLCGTHVISHLLDKDYFDPISGCPAFKFVPCRLERATR